ncbi:MAG: hypothetical protein P8R54_22000 [Myxococcota bacterium]|nr:hypothetical protein [Myxococcota bacterium]
MLARLPTLVLLGIALATTTGAIALLLTPPPAQHPEVAAAFLDVLDADRDGGISAAEYTAAADQTLPFSLADIDRDGMLHAWELEVILVSLSPLRDSRLVRVQ